MEKRALRLLVAALLTISFIGVAPVASAHTGTGTSHYRGGCEDAQATGGTFGMTYERGYGNGFAANENSHFMIAAKGTIRPYALDPCTGGTTTLGEASLSYVWGADLQGDDVNGNPAFVQIGIGKSRMKSGYANAICNAYGPWPNDQTLFVFTGFGDGSPGSNTWGKICPAWWVDFNDDGVMDYPKADRTYTFSISVYNSGTSNYWRYCVTDNADVVTDCWNQARHIGDGGLRSAQSVWWGCEASNSASAIGVDANLPDVPISQTAYMYAGSTVWNYTENSRVHGQWQGWPSYYHAAQDQAGLGESVSCYTSLHS